MTVSKPKYWRSAFVGQLHSQDVIFMGLFVKQQAPGKHC